MGKSRTGGTRIVFYGRYAGLWQTTASRHDGRRVSTKSDFADIVRCQLPRIYGHQKALTGIARATLIGQQFKIPILRLDEDQPHLAAAFRAGHLNSGLKTRTGWRRSGYLHDILISNGRDASKDITREPGFRSRQNVRAGTASTVTGRNRPLTISKQAIGQ